MDLLEETNVTQDEYADDGNAGNVEQLWSLDQKFPLHGTPPGDITEHQLTYTEFFTKA